MIETPCPECEYHVKINGRPQKGQRLSCPACHTNLVVVSLYPVELDFALSAKHMAPLKKVKVVEVFCPECEHPIQLSPHTRQGQQVICDMCDSMLEVVSTNPLEVDVTLNNLRRSRWKRDKKQKNFERKADQEEWM